LPPDVVKGCIGGADGAVWSLRLALPEHGAACLNEDMPKVHDVNAGNGRFACHKLCDRRKDGGDAVVGGIVGHYLDLSQLRDFSGCVGGKDFILPDELRDCAGCRNSIIHWQPC
jgi:hypothetical protein